MSKCLVTGANGVVGSAIAERLRHDGHEVHTAWRTPEYDYVFNCAAVSRTSSCAADPMLCHSTNCTGALSIFRSFKCRIVHSSSNVVLGSPTWYWASKLAAEHYLDAANAAGADVIGLRYSNVLSPNYKKGDPAVFPTFRDCREANGYVEVYGDGQRTRNFTWIDEIVDANMLAAFHSRHRGILDIAHPRPVTMNEFAACFGCEIRRFPDKVFDNVDIQQHAFPALETLGWSAQVPLEEAILRSL